MRITIGLLAVSAFCIGACSSSDDTMTGLRSDGVRVECEEGDEEDVLTCTPEDGDETCEDWENGGEALVLWPPNHKLVRFTLDDCAPVDCDGEDDGGDDAGDGGEDDGEDDGGDDAGDDGGDVDIVDRPAPGPSGAAPLSITSITADEDVEVGAGGDGHTTDFDMVIVDDVTFDLRSERQGGGDGRVYRVNYLDEDGNEGSCEILVPHDHRGPFAGAVDSGTAVTITP
jgi:hypothetical protein